MPTRLRLIIATLCCSIVGILVIGLVGWALVAGTGYSLLSKSPSPSGKFTIYEFRSNQDGFGHAPYGNILAISPRAKLTAPDDGYVFFAGYCQSPVAYEWRDDANIAVRCIGGDRDAGPRTLVAVAYGIRLHYSWQ